jgi:hypothetical protein
MDDGGPFGQAGRTPGAAWKRGLGVLALGAILTLAGGCSHLAPPRPTRSSAAVTKITKCGATRTAANVPVNLEVVKGNTACQAALRVEHAYAEAIRSGRAPGNGGGGPVKVLGWTCQGFTTPEVLATGKASKCVRPGAEILEILPPTGSG